MGVVIAVVALLSLVAAGVHGCSLGFHDVGGQCYSFRSEMMVTRDEARAVCAQMGANVILASVTNADTHRDIYKYIITYDLTGSFWLGGSDQVNEGDWQWEDGSRVLRGTPFWAIHNSVIGWVQEPDGGSNENCLIMDTDRRYYFNDVSCDLKHHPMCQETV